MRSKAIEIIKMANDIDINIVTKLLMEERLLGKKKAGDKGFLCPYHSEKSGSFMIYKNIGKCFGCETKVRTPMLYSDVHLKNKILELPKKNPLITSDELLEFYNREKHLALWEASVALCYRENLISKTRRDRHLRYIKQCRKSGNIPKLYPENKTYNSLEVNYDGNFDTSINTNSFNNEINSLEDLSKKVLSNYDFKAIASRKGLHIVYSILRESIIEVRGDALLPHHRKHLKEERFMSEEEIDFYKYFSTPNRKEKSLVLRKVLSKIKNCGIKIDILKLVPGFIYNEEKDFYSITDLYGVDAIAIPMEDSFSNIKRIQLRPDTGMKTAWFSTPGAGNCKAPSTIRYPLYTNYKDFVNGDLKPKKIIYKQVDPQTICEEVEDETCLMFTEGDYKAVKSCNLLNIPCLSTQGLTPWYNMFVEYVRIKRTLSKRQRKVTKGFIAFDCDTKFKRGLTDKSKGVHRVLKSEGIEAFYITWKYKYGKGIDDVINNGHADKLLVVSAEVYEKKYDLIIEILSIRSKKPPIYLEEEDIQPYYETLEEKSVSELEVMLEKLKLTNSILMKLSNNKEQTLDEKESKELLAKVQGMTLDELRKFQKNM